MKLNISNILTLARIIIIPIIVICIYLKGPFYGWIAFILFCLASVTDYFDGYIARIRNEITNFGTFLDPIADKFLILSAFLSFLFLPVLSSVISIWMFLIILFRDIFITGLKVLLNSTGRKIQTSKFAKFKTAFQMIAVYFILIYLFFLLK